MAQSAVYNTTKGGIPSQKQPWPGHEEELRPMADHGEESYKGSGKLKDKVAIITGGDSGIGKAIAIAFAREGADVAISYINENEDALDTLKWVKEAGKEGIGIPGDVADRQQCHDTVESVVKQFGRLDILVNNAAFQWEVDDIEELTFEQVDKTFKTNIYAYIWFLQAAVRYMKEGAAIINTGSVTAMEGSPGLIDYSATKGAIHTFTKTMAQALAKRGIRVNCVAPGPVWTPLIPATLTEEHIQRFGADTYWGRPAQPAELAPSYVFLASEDSRYYTGEILAPTGSSATR